MQIYFCRMAYNESLFEDTSPEDGNSIAADSRTENFWKEPPSKRVRIEELENNSSIEQWRTNYNCYLQDSSYSVSSNETERYF